MDRLAGPGDGNFDASDVHHTQCYRSGARFGNAIDFVVIGQCPDIDTIGSRPRRNRSRREHTIGNIGMAMKVDVKHGNPVELSR